MHNNYYQLDLDPFRLSPDARFAYPHPGFSEVRAGMRLALAQWDGILVVTGRPGTGKTTLCDDFLGHCKLVGISAASVVATSLERGEFLYRVARSLGVDDCEGANDLEAIKGFLMARPPSVLIVDEAQNLSEPALHEVLALCQLRRESQPLLLLFLVGQEELADKLAAPDQEQLRSLVSRANQLSALSLQDTSAYIAHRLGRAGWSGKPSISADAIVLLHRFSLGLPRHICKLGSRLLTHGAVEGLAHLDGRSVTAIVAELQEEMLLPLAAANNSADVTALQNKAWSELGDVVELTREESEFLALGVGVRTAPGLKPIAPATGPLSATSLVPEVSVSSKTAEQLARQDQGARRSAGAGYRYGLVIVAVLAAGFYAGVWLNEDPSGQQSSESRAVEDNSDISQPEAFVVDLEPSVGSEQMPVAIAAGERLQMITVTSRPVELPQTAPGMVEAEGGAVSSAELGQTIPAAPMFSIEVDKKISTLLSLGDQALAANRLTTPDKSCAYDYYSQVLALNPDSEEGTRGLRAIVRRYEQLANAMIKQGRYQIADVFILRGLAVVDAHPQLHSLRTILESRMAAGKDLARGKGKFVGTEESG